jgi:hypothetical protein
LADFLCPFDVGGIRRSSKHSEAISRFYPKQFNIANTSIDTSVEPNIKIDRKLKLIPLTTIIAFCRTQELFNMMS